MLAQWSLGTSYEGGHSWPAYFIEWASEEIDRELEPDERWGYGQQTYVIQCEETLRVKIGTAKQPEARLRLLQTGSSSTLRLIAILGIPEKEAHYWLREHRVRGEWFAWGPVVEAYVAEHRRAA